MKIYQGEIGQFPDPSGQLFVLDGPDLPFKVSRIYFISNVASQFSRGNHAHKSLQQVMWSIGGDITVSLDDGFEKSQFRLRDSRNYIHIPSGLWREISNFDSNATLMVAANQDYDETDYIRDYDEFLTWKRDVR